MTSLKDHPHLRTEFECRPAEALRIDTLYIPESFVDAVIERAKDDKTGLNEDYLKGAFLALITVPPKPVPEEVEKVFSRPHGKNWKVEVKSVVGHWLLTEFIRVHKQVKIEHVDDQLIMACHDCQVQTKIPLRRFPRAPSYFQLHVEECSNG